MGARYRTASVWDHRFLSKYLVFLPASRRSLHMPAGLLEVLRRWKTLCQTIIRYLPRFSLPKSGRTVFKQERMGSLLLREGIFGFAFVKSKDQAETALKADSQTLQKAPMSQWPSVISVFIGGSASSSTWNRKPRSPFSRKEQLDITLMAIIILCVPLCRFVLSPETIKATTRFSASAFVRLTVWRACAALSVGDNNEILCRSLVQGKLLSCLSLTETGAR